MRSEFEKWCYETGLVTNNRFFDNDGWESVNEEVTTAFDARNHQQSKVDELQKQRDSFIKAYEIEMDESVELQKRVDSTLKVVQSMRNEVKHGHMSDDESQTLSSYANDLEQALKGGEA